MKISDLIESYLNEKNTNIFLRYKKEIIDTFYNKLISQKSNLPDDKIIRSLYELEIERVEYIIREYLMTRIEKMKHDTNISTDLMSDNEKILYKKILMKYKISRNSGIDVVGFICKKDLGCVMLDGESVEMYKGDFFVGPVKDVYEMVNREEIYFV